ncbi:MAG TPA: hypothetical protein VGX03_06765 [Candidatus Binatia bacterium]|jgi:hypothetical protein|nr:hypothetical protein [Candidatus Binatia bacterium]
MIDVLGLLGDNDIDAHSSIVLTFTVDLLLYDGLIRRRLRNAGVVNQMVFCDLQTYQPEMAALSTTRQFGRSYSITPVYQNAAFHPKLYLLLGRKKGRLLIGSGNATLGGLLRNAEVFGLFEYDASRDDGPHPAFKESVQLIKSVAKYVSHVVRRQLDKAFAWTPWLELKDASDGRSLLVAGPGYAPLLDQIIPLLKGKVVKSVLVCSSSFDRKLLALQKLASLTKRGSIRCIVQPEIAQIDGRAVRQLGKTIDWRPFVDPYPPQKKKRKDVHAHAKLFVFDCGDSEIVVYGSANASRQALLDQDGNTEVVVVLPPLPIGTTVTLLGLDASLKAESIYNTLTEKTWTDEYEVGGPKSYECILTAAVPSEDGVIITLASGVPDPSTLLELTDGVERPPLARVQLIQKEGRMLGEAEVVPASARIARLVRPNGEPLSNIVGLTWPEVAHWHDSFGISARVEEAIASMQDGVVLGTVLFELLDHVRDFEIVFSGSGRNKSRNEQGVKGEGDSEEERPTESFYTDTLPGETNSARWVGDRADIDLLASLVQPLTITRRHLADEADDEGDDAAISEEAERREIDAKQGRATGEERRDASRVASLPALERASRRLKRRLNRAAESIEKALGDRKRLSLIPPSSIARQIWMAHIGAFLAGRIVLSSDNEEVQCLEPVDFAKYILRICRALTGGKNGGLFALLPANTWTGPDAETLQRGLAFLWSCSIWAAARITKYWQAEADDNEMADGIWDAVPELVVARFITTIRPYCPHPDTRDIAKRLPAWEDLELGWFEEWNQRIGKLADLIGSMEAVDSQQPQSTQSLHEPGILVYNPAVGVTVLAGITNDQKYQLLDLSRTKDEVRLFRADAEIVKIPLDLSFGKLIWRTPLWLEEHGMGG